MIKVEHEEMSEYLFGKPFTEVHEWLDGLFAKYSYAHRCHRHTKAGLSWIGDNMGADAAKAAFVHILQDIACEIPPGTIELLEVEK